MASHFDNLTIDCDDHYALMQWWKQVLDGYDDDPNDPNNPGDPASALVGPAGAPRLLFMPVPEGKTVKNRLHMDLRPQDTTRDEEVERIVGLGGTVFERHVNDDGTGWVTMLDPEGNEFCIERSTAEREQPAQPV
jgi:hypothetical protein